jgi:ATP-dependent helicase HrpB
VAETKAVTTLSSNPSCLHSRIASRGIAATGNSCSPPEDQRVCLIAAGTFSSPSTSKSVVELARHWCVWLLLSNQNGCWKRPSERSTLEWNRTAERVEQVSALVYDQLVIEETSGPAPDTDETAQMLAAKALEIDIGRFADKEALEQLRARASFAGVEIDVNGALTSLSRGRNSFAQLASANLLTALRPPGLDRQAPERLTLRGGREVKVHYDHGKPPWIESRLQDFFGVRETPRLGKVPVVVHLLAPNRRPVQVTSDLAGFWERLYPQVRRELSRRYPKHKWPENP